MIRSPETRLNEPPRNVFLKKAILFPIALVVVPLTIPVILIVALACRMTQDTQKPPRLVWGNVPIITVKYWSLALAKKGLFSRTLMYPLKAPLFKRDDFDIYVFDLVRWPFLGALFNRALTPYIAFLYALVNFDIFHLTVHGGFLRLSPLWRLEAFFLKLAKRRSSSSLWD